MLLTIMYFGMATSHEEEHEEKHETKNAHTRCTRRRSNTNQEE